MGSTTPAAPPERERARAVFFSRPVPARLWHRGASSHAIGGVRCGMSRKTPSVRFLWERRCPGGGCNADAVRRPPPSPVRAFCRVPEPMLVRPTTDKCAHGGGARPDRGRTERGTGFKARPYPPALGGFRGPRGLPLHADGLSVRGPREPVTIVSLLTISSTFDSLFKVLCIFPSRYLFAIGLSPVFSFGWNLPPV